MNNGYSGYAVDEIWEVRVVSTYVGETGNIDYGYLVYYRTGILS